MLLVLMFTKGSEEAGVICGQGVRHLLSLVQNTGSTPSRSRVIGIDYVSILHSGRQ